MTTHQKDSYHQEKSLSDEVGYGASNARSIGGEKIAEMIITSNSPPIESVEEQSDKEQSDPDYGRTTTLYTDTFKANRSRNIFVTIPKSYQDFDELHYTLKKMSKNISYALTAKEEHIDGTPHYHINIASSNALEYKSVLKHIFKVKGNIGGSINIQLVRNSNATVTYIKKHGNFKEEGTPPLASGRPKDDLTPQQKLEQNLLHILSPDNTDSIDVKLQTILQNEPAYTIQHADKIKAQLKQLEQPVRLKWEYEVRTPANTTLKPYQQKIWDILQTPPKQRQIIWVTGPPGTGKSFIYNYIQDNYKYGSYSAGQSASLDNIVYGYDEEGVIMWDLPKNYTWSNEDLVNSLTSSIEKFSDYGQLLTSKKYKGNKVRALGHVIIFSNRTVLDQLKHRDIIEICTDTTVQEINLNGTTHYYNKVTGYTGICKELAHNPIIQQVTE